MFFFSFRLLWRRWFQRIETFERKTMSLATGSLRLGFGIAGESPGDALTWLLASILSTDIWLWCRRQNAVLIWYTPGVTLATAFCCFNMDWLVGREQRLCGRLECLPAAPAGAILQVLLWILALNVTAKSDYPRVHLANELSRDTGTAPLDFHLVSRFSHKLFAL